jgi:hypothetical protein
MTPLHGSTHHAAAFGDGVGSRVPVGPGRPAASAARLTVVGVAPSRPRDSTIRKLYALSMNRCAYPGCPTLLVPPDTESNVGQVCHIRGKSVGGPRYDESQTDEDRHGFANLVLMCGVHHKMIDADVQRHTGGVAARDQTHP